MRIILSLSLLVHGQSLQKASIVLKKAEWALPLSLKGENKEPPREVQDTFPKYDLSKIGHINKKMNSEGRSSNSQYYSKCIIKVRALDIYIVQIPYLVNFMDVSRGGTQLHLASHNKKVKEAQGR